jgi:nitroreductase
MFEYIYFPLEYQDMEAVEAILNRRSIRRFQEKAISEDTITELLKAAMSAPSANNKQPWHYIVISERKKLDLIPEFHPYSSMLKQAPVAIAVCGDTVEQPDYWVQDCSAATQNILLTAHAKGLGAVWLAIYPRVPRIKELQQMLSLPEYIIPLSLVALGYPDENKLPSDRYNQSKVHFNLW